jgi:hypothetical protein
MRLGKFDEAALLRTLGEPITTGNRIASESAWTTVEGVDFAAPPLSAERYLIWDCLGAWDDLTRFESHISNTNASRFGNSADAVRMALEETREDLRKIMDRLTCIAIQEGTGDVSEGVFNLVNVCSRHAVD